MSSKFSYREMETMGLGLITLDWIDLMSLATAFGWRPSTTDGGIDVHGRRRPSLVAALELAKAALTVAPGEREKILELDAADDCCSCYENVPKIRESVISSYLAEWGQDESISNVEEFIDAAQDWARRDF